MKVVIVTGGAYGIGRAVVRRFAQDGDSVVIADVNEQRGHEVEKDFSSVVFCKTDVRYEDQIEKLVDFTLERFGRIDVVCSNAGIERYKRADEYTTKDWSDITDTNLRAGFLLAKHTYPSLQKSRGCIVFTSSVQAFANEKNISVYASSKAGLLGLMRGMAIDFASGGVRVNAVCPGATMTGMMEAGLTAETDHDAALRSLAASIPLGRIGTPEDVAHAVAFLASEKAVYITGTQIVVDGGILARLSL